MSFPQVRKFMNSFSDFQVIDNQRFKELTEEQKINVKISTVAISIIAALGSCFVRKRQI